MKTFSEEAEIAVLGLALLDEAFRLDLMDAVLPEMFFSEPSKTAYATLIKLSSESSQVDVVTVGSAINNIEFTLSCAENPVGFNAGRGYIGVIVECYERRLLYDACQSTLMQLSDGVPPAKAKGDLSLALLGEDKKNTTTVSMKQSLKDVVAEIDRRNKTGETIHGARSGIDELDKLTGGFGEGDLVIIAGRPGMGKTAFGMGIVREISKTDICQVFSFEMPHAQLTERLVAREGKISYGRIRSGQLLQDEWEKLSYSVTTLSQCKNITIDDQPGITVGQLISKSKRLALKHGKPRIIMIDYLQIMQYNKDKAVSELGTITMSLKCLAKEMGCTVLLLSQLNRSLESRPNKRPVNSDLRDSGTIEQDADTIIFPYRDEVYNDDSPQKGVAELIIGKSRHSETGTVYASCDLRYMMFGNLSSMPSPNKSSGGFSYG